jgi:hypothetical protein
MHTLPSHLSFELLAALPSLAAASHGKDPSMGGRNDVSLLD